MLNQFLHNKLNKLYFREKNMLLNIKTWKDFFYKIVEEISHNLLHRIEKNKI